jgi:hypothetical protein
MAPYGRLARRSHQGSNATKPCADWFRSTAIRFPHAGGLRDMPEAGQSQYGNFGGGGGGTTKFLLVGAAIFMVPLILAHPIQFINDLTKSLYGSSANGVVASDPSRPWQGNWQGTASDSRGQSYTISMKLTEAEPGNVSSIAGYIYYPGGQCNATLVQAHVADGKLLIRENDPPGPCTSGTWSFVASGPNIDAFGSFDNASTLRVTFVRTA